MNDRPVQTVEPSEMTIDSPDVQGGDLHPNNLISKALENEKINTEVLQNLMDLRERHEKNKAEKAFNKAMAQLRGDLPEIKKDNHVSHSGASYKYEQLSDITSKVAPIMHEYGLSYRWLPDVDKKWVKLGCEITHELGHSQITSLKAPIDTTGSKNRVQAIGSTVSYLQRYTLKCALGIAAAPDDDAQSAGRPERNKGKKSKNKKGGRSKKRSVCKDGTIKKGGPLHKKIEATLNEHDVDREEFKRFLAEPKTNMGDDPSMIDFQASEMRKFLNNTERTIDSFEEWKSLQDDKESEDVINKERDELIANFVGFVEGLTVAENVAYDYIADAHDLEEFNFSSIPEDSLRKAMENPKEFKKNVRQYAEEN